MMKLEFSEEIKGAAPELRVLAIEAEVKNPPTGDDLWMEVEEEAANISVRFDNSLIKLRPGIAATRDAYKALGKDPSRYRPSQEQLCRRAVSGKGLYRLTTLVDIINLVSLASGYSIGGFDADRIVGDTLILGRGMKDELYCGIGRGPLNIEGLPVWRDAEGGIGTPTSDEERTKLTEQTRRLLMIVNMFGDEMQADEVLELTSNLLKRYASAEHIDWQLVKVADSM